MATIKDKCKSMYEVRLVKKRKDKRGQRKYPLVSETVVGEGVQISSRNENLSRNISCQAKKAWLFAEDVRKAVWQDAAHHASNDQVRVLKQNYFKSCAPDN